MPREMGEQPGSVDQQRYEMTMLTAAMMIHCSTIIPPRFNRSLYEGGGPAVTRGSCCTDPAEEPELRSSLRYSIG